jgi:hypothetical protein
MPRADETALRAVDEGSHPSADSPEDEKAAGSDYGRQGPSELGVHAPEAREKVLREEPGGGAEVADRDVPHDPGQGPKVKGAEMYWGDEMGLMSDHQTGTSYSRRGRMPVLPRIGQWFSTNMISTVTSRGHLCFMVFSDGFRARVFLNFLHRLGKQAKRKVLVIVDGHPMHRAKLVQAWPAKPVQEIELFYLPSYSPELNSDELLNNDIWIKALGQRGPSNKAAVVADVRNYLRSNTNGAAVELTCGPVRHPADILPTMFRLDIVSTLLVPEQ